MKKSILNLKGARELSKNEQKTVNGGKFLNSGYPMGTSCDGTNPHGAPYCCINSKIDICGYGFM